MSVWAIASATLRAMLRSKLARTTTIIAIAVSTLVGWAERHGDSVSSATHALTGAWIDVLVPLSVLGLVSALVGPGRLADVVRCYARIGSSPIAAAIAMAGVGAAMAGGTFAVSGAIVAALAHGPHDPPVALDALRSGGIAGATGAAYAVMFTAGASFGRRGGGRGVVLIVDWILGSSFGAGAAFSPKASAAALFGTVEVPAWPLPLSWLWLGLLSVASVGVIAWRMRRGSLLKQH